MNILKYPNVEINKLINSYIEPYTENKELVLSKYCTINKEDDHIEIFNSLNQSIVSMNNDEYENILIYNSKYPSLYNYLFIHPKDFDIEKLGTIVREHNHSKQAPTVFKYVRSYVIFTTMLCNARCFYCYESHMKKGHMSLETANKIPDFIEKKWNKKDSIHITWMGGEPLFNEKIIDTITSGLKKKNIPFTTKMFTNGYLFSEDKIDKYINDWHLKAAQITLDGTKEIYNKTKSYIYKKDENPFEKVINNIKLLSNNNIKLNIRLNVGVHNGEDLVELNKYLQSIKNKNINIYARLLFVDSEGGGFTEKERTKLLSNIAEINKLNNKTGCEGSVLGYREKVCMADNGRTLLISYDGHLGLCDHFSDKDFLGTIDNPDYNQEIIQSYRKYVNMDKCKDCFIYPNCKRIEKCIGSKDFCLDTNLEFVKNCLKKHMHYLYVNDKKKREKIRKQYEEHPEYFEVKK